MTSAELKPCPFCGSEAKLMGGPYAQETYSIWCNGKKGKRHHLSFSYDRNAAITEWNTRAAPNVKPLVWDDWDGVMTVAKTTLGTYSLSASFRLLFTNGSYRYFETEQAAKAAAQADNTRRILEALE